MANTFREDRGGRGGREGRGGRGQNAGQNAGGGRGQGVPMNAPSGPATMRGDVGRGHASGGRVRRGFGFGGRGGGRGAGGRGGWREESGANLQPAPQAAANPTIAAPRKAHLDPERFKPFPGYVDQSLLGNIGSRQGFPNCLRCGSVKGFLLPAFVNCRNTCHICCRDEHHGEPCRLIYANFNWWGARHGSFPSQCRPRPTEAQRQKLARRDPWFLENPTPVQELQDLPALARKRKVKDEEEVLDAIATAVEVTATHFKKKAKRFERSLADAEVKAAEASKIALDSESNNWKTKRQIREIEGQLEHVTKALALSETKNEQLSALLERKDAEQGRLQANIDAIIAKARASWEEEKNAAIASAVAAAVAFTRAEYDTALDRPAETQQPMEEANSKTDAAEPVMEEEKEEQE